MEVGIREIEVDFALKYFLMSLIEIEDSQNTFHDNFLNMIFVT